MQSVADIELRDVIQYVLPGFIQCLLIFSMHSLFFQACEAAFCHSITPAIAFSTHTALDVDAVGR
ncbi:MAG: hypothetical protein ACJASL_005124 [Paraglaciecola sp.]|jgi:hypothetical protein